jgi:hypothetical protein
MRDLPGCTGNYTTGDWMMAIQTVQDFNRALHKDGSGKFTKPGWGAQVRDDGEWCNEECYAQEPCPKCGDGCVYGADFPNGDAEGQCLKCGTSLVWDNDTGEWIV